MCTIYHIQWNLLKKGGLTQFPNHDSSAIPMKRISPIWFSLMGCMEKSCLGKLVGRDFVADRIPHEGVHLNSIGEILICH